MKKLYYKKFVLLFISFFLSACESTLIKSDNSYHEVSAQATIEITQAVKVSPNSARAFLQNGKLITQGQLNLYDINCEIEINTVSENYQTIEAGIFNVISIAQDESPIVKSPYMKKPVMIASLNYAWSSDSPVDIKRYFHFKLSAQNPKSKSEVQVRAVTCRGAQDTPYNAKLPTYEQMREAGGQYIIFKL